MFRTNLSRPTLAGESLTRLGLRWRDLAARSGASYFQDWGWVGCMAAERYRDPVLIEVMRDDQLVAMALFNRKRGGWRLQESAESSLRSIFVEHNGPLVAIADPVLRQAVLADLFGQAMRASVDGVQARPRRIMLAGVGPDSADALSMVGGVLNESATRMAPYIDFAAMHADTPFIEGLSRNSRHQIRRSNRLYADAGALAIKRADTAGEGQDFLSEMIHFHDMTWKARGKRGAFGTAAVRRFYASLLDEGIPAGEVDLLRVSAGPAVVGYLMNFVHGSVVSAYQSGFNYGAAGPHQKPGLTCHFLAIEHYRARGYGSYDFLAGADRYKLSLSNARRWLHWLSVTPGWQPGLAGLWLRKLAQAKRQPHALNHAGGSS